MILDKNAEKLPNAINYFVRHTKHCHKTKLFKLLYFLDFQHYQEIGRSVTQLEYFAWPKGPVPVELQNNFGAENQYEDFFHAEERPFEGWGSPTLYVEPKREFNERLFSKRELRLLRDLAKEYKDKKSEDMVEATHLENLPWHQVYEVEGRKQQQIPYSLALRKSEKEDMERLIQEGDEFKKLFSFKPKTG